jgi:hypothetical protein
MSNTSAATEPPPTEIEIAAAVTTLRRAPLAVVLGLLVAPATPVETTYSTRDPGALKRRGYSVKHFAELCRDGEIEGAKDQRGWKATESAIARYEAARTEASRARRRAGQLAKPVKASPANDVAASDRAILERLAVRSGGSVRATAAEVSSQPRKVAR